ncbi:NAD(P)-binding protein [Mycena sanguinolenta]|uniref:NAD(P)-binding protein n=1 Tax=Mycena sanguinolenta TaxID=230812 RepID=A0A8H7DCF0_9AGAR|nr:NAD(P)-binding protein [Mycena sanguinolenta]
MSFDRIPKGSLILITGATGFIGSAVTDAALRHGFKVRGVTRSISKASVFVKSLEDKYGKGAIEMVEVKDLTVPDAFDGTLEGVSLFITFFLRVHVGARCLRSAVQSTVVLMKAAAKAPSVNSFILTSSRVAVFVPDYDQPDISPKVDQWADHMVTAAKQTPDDHPTKPVLVYAASKVESERAAFEFYNSARPSYAFNTVLPDLVFGPVFNPTPGMYTTHSFLNSLFLSEPEPLILNFVKPAPLAVDVRDVASMHLAALLSSSMQERRIWAAAHRFEINDILAIWREEFPERKFVEDFKLPPQPKITLDLTESEELLRAFEGRSWLPFRETVIVNVQDVL